LHTCQHKTDHPCARKATAIGRLRTTTIVTVTGVAIMLRQGRDDLVHEIKIGVADIFTPPSLIAFATLRLLRWSASEMLSREALMLAMETSTYYHL
jgi:hypothetical protein